MFVKHARKNILICLTFGLQFIHAEERPRVFIQAASAGNTWNARRDQSIEMAKDFVQDCPGTKVSIYQNKADYIIILNHIEVGFFARDNQIEVADRDGDLLTTRERGGIRGGVKAVCTIILDDWRKQNGKQTISGMAPTLTNQSALPNPRALTISADKTTAPAASAVDSYDLARASLAAAVDKEIRDEGVGFAEGDGTTLVVRSMNADRPHNRGIAGNEVFISELQNRGFTRLIYISDRGQTFTWEAPFISKRKMEPREFKESAKPHRLRWKDIGAPEF